MWGFVGKYVIEVSSDLDAFFKVARSGENKRSSFFSRREACGEFWPCSCGFAYGNWDRNASLLRVLQCEVTFWVLN